VTEIEEILARLEELEARIKNTRTKLLKLTPSDDLEAVKRAVNSIIDLLSKN